MVARPPSPRPTAVARDIALRVLGVDAAGADMSLTMHSNTLFYGDNLDTF